MDNQISICSWNANSASNKIGEIKEFLIRTKVHIMLLNETKLDDNFKLKIRNYTVLRNDRNRHAGE